MSTSVAAAGASSGQPVIDMDPDAAVLVLMDETQADMSKVQSPAPSSSGGNGGSGHALDQYA